MVPQCQRQRRCEHLKATEGRRCSLCCCCNPRSTSSRNHFHTDSKRKEWLGVKFHCKVHHGPCLFLHVELSGAERHRHAGVWRQQCCQCSAVETLERQQCCQCTAVETLCVETVEKQSSAALFTDVTVNTSQEFSPFAHKRTYDTNTLCESGAPNWPL